MKHASVNLQLFEYLRSRIAALELRLDLPDFSFSVVLLTLHSILWPYRGIVHDARLYALQALNHLETGRYAQDLFFAFGSQDAFSLFSFVVGPMVGLLGAVNTFWVAYLASSMLLVYGEVRLIRRIIPDRMIANLGLIALVAIPLPYGGWEVFHVQESFFTARLIAEGFALLGITSALEGRKLSAIACAAASIALHAIMGIGALLVVLVLLFGRKICSRKSVSAVVLILVGLSALLLIFDRRAIISTMEMTWFNAVKLRNFQCFPSQWRFMDWYLIVGCIGIGFAACRYMGSRAKHLVQAVLIVSFAGLVSTVFGEYGRVPLLIQGQGYRAFWMAEVIALPLGILLIQRLFREESIGRKWSAMVVLFFLADPLLLCSEAVPFSISILIMFFLLLVLTAVICLHRTRDFHGISLKHTLVAGCILLSMLLSLLSVVVLTMSGISRQSDPISAFHAAMDDSGRVFLFIVAALCVFTLALPMQKHPKRCLLWTLPLWIILSGVAFVSQNNISYRMRFESGYKDLAFIAETIGNQLPLDERNGRQHIYWPEHAALIWFELRSNSYFSFTQTAGALFSRELTLEAQRRAGLAKPFEVAWIKKNTSFQKYDEMRLAAVNGTLHDPPPRREDVFKLATDETLDWLVLEEGIDGLYSAGNMSVYIYNCSEIRSGIERKQRAVADRYD